MIKQYNLFKTAKKTAKENGLTTAVSRYTATDNLYYDFSLLDTIQGLSADDREAIEADTMNHHAVSWYSQPMPTIILQDNFTHFIGQIQTAPHRIYKKDGRRIMVIIEITGVKIEKQRRTSVYNEFSTAEIYEAHNHNHEADFELD